MRMPRRCRRPLLLGRETSTGPSIGGSSPQSAAALRWLSTAPSPKARTAPSTAARCLEQHGRRRRPPGATDANGRCDNASKSPCRSGLLREAGRGKERHAGALLSRRSICPGRFSAPLGKKGARVRRFAPVPMPAHQPKGHLARNPGMPRSAILRHSLAPRPGVFSCNGVRSATRRTWLAEMSALR